MKTRTVKVAWSLIIFAIMVAFFGMFAVNAELPPAVDDSGLGFKVNSIWTVNNLRFRLTNVAEESIYAELCGYNDDSIISADIPAQFIADGKIVTVTAIKERAFVECASLQVVSIPKNVTTIGANAFSECRSLKTVTILGNLSNIDNNAFAGCNSLTTVEYKGATVPTCGDDIFEGTKVKSVKVTANYQGADFAGITKEVVNCSSCFIFDSTTGKCTVCGAFCTHKSYANGICEACGYVCIHVTEKDENKATCLKKAVCDLCSYSYGEQSNHSFNNSGVCTNCLMTAKVMIVCEGHLELDQDEKVYYYVSISEAVKDADNWSSVHAVWMKILADCNEDFTIPKTVTIFDGDVFNFSGNIINLYSDIANGIFNGTFTHQNGIIEGGIFNGDVINKADGMIWGGTFNCTLANAGVVKHSGVTVGSNFQYVVLEGGTVEGDHNIKTAATCQTGDICVICGEIGEPDSSKHNFNPATGKCGLCDYACNHIESQHTFAADQNNGTHNFICTLCGSDVNELHYFDKNGRCICGTVATYTVSMYKDYGVKIVSVNGVDVVEGETIVVEHGKSLTVVMKNVASEIYNDIIFDAAFIGNNYYLPGQAECPDIDNTTLTFAEGIVTDDIKIVAYACVNVTVDMGGGTVSNSNSDMFTIENGIASLKNEREMVDVSFEINSLFEKTGHTLVFVKDQNGNVYDSKFRLEAAYDQFLTLIWKCSNLAYVEANAATCTTAGNIEYWTCSCGKLYSNEIGENEITLENVTIFVDENAHIYPDTPNDYTITGDTHTELYICEHNMHHIKELPGIEHTYTNGICACGKVCNHTGNTSFITNNGGETHSYICSVCSVSVTEAHDHTNGKCICGEKAIPSYTVPTSLTAIYGDMLAEVILPEGFSWQNETITFVGNAGINTFKATYTPDDQENYKVVTDIDVIVEVAKATPNYTLPSDIVGYVGQNEAEVVLPDGWTWHQSIVSNPVFLKCGHIGSQWAKVCFTPTDTENYSVIEESIEFIVLARLSDAMVTIEDQVYNGFELMPNVTVTIGGEALTVGMDYTVSYTNNVNVGTATVTITAVDGRSVGTIIGTFEISKANPSIVGLTANDLTYTGEALELITVGDVNGGTVQYSLDNAVWSDVIPTAKDAGTYTVYYNVIGDSNHNDILGGSCLVTVVPKKVVLVWENTDMVYNNTRQTPAPRVFGVASGDVCEVAVSGWGKYGGTYIARATALSNPNYVLPDNTECIFTITADPVRTAIDVTVDIYEIIPNDVKVSVADSVIGAAEETVINMVKTVGDRISETIKNFFDGFINKFSNIWG